MARTQTRPTLVLLAGPNGVGKTSYYETILRSIPQIRRLELVNADAIAKQLNPAHPEVAAEPARLAADARRAQLIRAGTSFCTETVFSHPSKIELIREAQAAAFEVVLVFICVDSPALSAARVSFRVHSDLGHDVPYEKIIARYPRAIAHAEEAALLADYAALVDNSRIAEPWRLVMALDHGKLQILSQDLPGWAMHIVKAVLGHQAVARRRLKSKASTGRGILRGVVDRPGATRRYPKTK